MIITTRLLQQHKACDDQLALFEATFGPGPAKTGVEVTPETCRRAAEAGLDFDWAAESLLTLTQRAEYERVVAPAEAEYGRARGVALAEFNRVKGVAMADFERVIAPARAEYRRIAGAAFAAACQAAP